MDLYKPLLKKNSHKTESSPPKAKINIKAGVRPKPFKEKKPKKEDKVPVKVLNENDAYEIIVRKKGVETVTEVQVPHCPKQHQHARKRTVIAESELPECCRPKKKKPYKKKKYRSVYIMEVPNPETGKYEIRMRSDKPFPPLPPSKTEPMKHEEVKTETKPSVVSRDCATSPTCFQGEALTEFNRVLAQNLPNTEFSFDDDQSRSPSLPKEPKRLNRPIRRDSDPVLSAFRTDEENILVTELLAPVRVLEETFLDEEVPCHESEGLTGPGAISDSVFSAVHDAQTVLLDIDSDYRIFKNPACQKIPTADSFSTPQSAISVVPASELMNGDFPNSSTLLTPPETIVGAEFSPTSALTEFEKESGQGGDPRGGKSKAAVMQNYLDNYSHFETGNEPHAGDNLYDLDLSFLGDF